MIKLYQGTVKSGAKKGEVYYSLAKNQSGVLTVVSGRYGVKTDKDGKQIGMLSVSLHPTSEGELEVVNFNDGKVQPTIPFEYPIVVHIKCILDGDNTAEKAAHALFTSNEPIFEYSELNSVTGESATIKASGVDMAKGFAGEISWADTPGAKRIISGDKVKEHDWASFADIKLKESTISEADVPGVSGAGSYGGGAKAQTESEKFTDRLACMVKACTAESPEGIQVSQLSKSLGIEPYLVIQILLG